METSSFTHGRLVRVRLAPKTQCTELHCAAHHCCACAPCCLRRPSISSTESICLRWQPHRGRRSQRSLRPQSERAGCGQVAAAQLRFVPGSKFDQRLQTRAVTVCGCRTLCECVYVLVGAAVCRACGLSPSPALEAPSSKSSRVPLCELRYVAGTQPCSSAVLTNHQPMQRKQNRTTSTAAFKLQAFAK